jgi:threonine synthase
VCFPESERRVGLARDVFRSNVGKGMWRYAPLLPILEAGRIVTLGEGGTPLLTAGRVSRTLGLNHLYLKLESINPTGAFKDRESSMAVTVAAGLGVKRLACASTGTLAASLAAYAARAGLECVVFVPDVTPGEKTVQMAITGAKVVRVRGIYERAQALQEEASRIRGWYSCSTAVNPYRAEGDKTIAFEICEQLDFAVPDWVIVPVGGGGNLVGQWKGYKELQELGLVKETPRMIGVGVEAGCPLALAFESGSQHVRPGSVGETVAGALLSAFTDYGDLALSAIRESGGRALAVGDSDLLWAQRLLAEQEGIFAEPAAAAPIAALAQLLDDHIIDQREHVVCIVTGEGLHDMASVLPHYSPSPVLDDSLASVREYLSEDA